MQGACVQGARLRACIARACIVAVGVPVPVPRPYFACEITRKPFFGAKAVFDVFLSRESFFLLRESVFGGKK
jgi:hypothetical protein